MFILRVETEVRPTENPEKVIKAVLNIFDLSREVKLIKSGEERYFVVAESRSISSLFKFYEKLRQERILDTARGLLLSSLRDNMLSFKLNKQVAYAGHVSFVTADDESPLGAISVTIISEKLREIVDWLTPKTSKGRPLWEREVPKV